MSDKTGIYLVGFPERNEYKIGLTTNGLAARLKDMATGWAKDPTYQRFWPCPDANLVESKAHEYFNNQRTDSSREWFTFNQEELPEVEKVLSWLSGGHAESTLNEITTELKKKPQRKGLPWEIPEIAALMLMPPGKEFDKIFASAHNRDLKGIKFALTYWVYPPDNLVTSWALKILKTRRLLIDRGATILREPVQKIAKKSVSGAKNILPQL